MSRGGQLPRIGIVGLRMLRDVVYGTEVGPMAIAHRGGASLAPENTLEAFGLATSLGFRYLETDVRTTRDGQIVCFHDATLDRVTDGRGRVQRHSLHQLRSLRVNGVAPIPTLAEALETFADSNFTVDLKDEAAIEPLSDLLRHEQTASRVCVAGAWDRWLTRLRRRAPNALTALGWGSLSALVWRSRTGQPLPTRVVDASFAHVPIRFGSVPIVIERLITDAHSIGVRVIVWTVNDPQSMHRLLDVGVDGIITDRPDLLREVLVVRGAWVPATPTRPTC